jgi:hypothetical protein
MCASEASVRCVRPSLGEKWPPVETFGFLASILYLFESRDSIIKLLRSPVIDSKESIPPVYVGWRAGTTILFLFGSYSPQRLF